MKKEIVRIVNELKLGDITTKQAKKELLSLFGVSGSCSHCPMEEKPDVVGQSEQLPFNKCRDGVTRNCNCTKVDDCRK